MAPSCRRWSERQCAGLSEYVEKYGRELGGGWTGGGCILLRCMLLLAAWSVAQSHVLALSPQQRWPPTHCAVV